MADMQQLREMLKQRMATMADEIMDLFQATIREFIEERATPSPDPGDEALFPPLMAQSPLQNTEIPEQPSMIEEERHEVYSREEEPVLQKLPNIKMCTSDASAEETDTNLPCTINGNKALLPWIKLEEEEVRCSPGEQLSTLETPQLPVCSPVAPSDCSGRTETPIDWTGTPVAPTDFTVKSEAPGDWTGTPVVPTDFTVKSEASGDWTGTPVAPTDFTVKSEASTDFTVKSEAPSDFSVKSEVPSECNRQMEAFQQSHTIEQTPDVQTELVVRSSFVALHERKETPPPPLLRREDLQSSSTDIANEEANSPPPLQFESDATLDSSNSDMEESEDDIKYKFCKIPSKIRRKVPQGHKTQSKAAERCNSPPDGTSDSSNSDDDRTRRPHKRRRTLKKSQKPKGKQKAGLKCSNCEKCFKNIDALEKHKRTHFPT